MGVGHHSLLQWIFLTQGLNLGLLHCRQILYYLNHQKSPIYSYSWIVFHWIANTVIDIICTRGESSWPTAWHLTCSNKKNLLALLEVLPLSPVLRSKWHDKPRPPQTLWPTPWSSHTGWVLGSSASLLALHLTVTAPRNTAAGISLTQPGPIQGGCRGGIELLCP